MPTDELAAYDRMYLDHGMTATWDGSVSILAGLGRRRRDDGELDDLDPGPAQRARGVGPRPRHRWRRWRGVRRRPGRRSSASSGSRDRPTCRQRTRPILRGAAALGWEAAETRRNGVACGDCGSCPFGCRRGAKQSGLRVHLAEAWRNGARILPDASVRRVLVDGGRASGVEARLADGRSGHRPCSAGRARGRSAADARDPRAERAAGTRRSGGTCGSIRCR